MRRGSAPAIAALALCAVGAWVVGCGANVSVEETVVLEAPGQPPLNLRGEFHTCGSTMRFDGMKFVETRHRDGCRVEGRFERDGPASFAWIVSASTCPETPARVDGVKLTRSEAGFTWEHEAFGLERYFGPNAGREHWRISGTRHGKRAETDAVVLTTPDGAAGCYWSTDGECGGLFSCGWARPRMAARWHVVGVPNVLLRPLSVRRGGANHAGRVDVLGDLQLSKLRPNRVR